MKIEYKSFEEAQDQLQNIIRYIPLRKIFFNAMKSCKEEGFTLIPEIKYSMDESYNHLLEINSCSYEEEPEEYSNKEYINIKVKIAIDIERDLSRIKLNKLKNYHEWIDAGIDAYRYPITKSYEGEILWNKF